MGTKIAVAEKVGVLAAPSLSLRKTGRELEAGVLGPALAVVGWPLFLIVILLQHITPPEHDCATCRALRRARATAFDIPKINPD